MYKINIFMKNKYFIPVFKPSITNKNRLDVLKALYFSEISGTSNIVKEFEESIAKKFDREYAVSVSNGSVALDLAFQFKEFKEQDEIILPSFTIISCLSSILRTNAKPIFCDVDKDTWCMTLDEVKKNVTEKTKAILVVHTYGLTAEIKKIEKFCEEKNILLIEDSAEAHGILIDNKACGSFGLMSTMSFYANKHITAGEGGAVLTDDKKVYDKLLQMRNLDFTSKKRFQHDNFYWNYRMGGLQAALGKSQINDINKTIKYKISQGNYYQELLKDQEDFLQLPLKEANGVPNNYWVFGILLKKENIREKVTEELDKKGIETRPFFWPLHLQNALLRGKKSNNRLIVSENLGKNGFYIPMGKHVSKKTQKFITTNLISFVNKYS
jgi:perosamine synthetase